MKGIISLWQICRDKLLSVPTDQAQEQSSARTFCLKYSSQPIAQCPGLSAAPADVLSWS